MNRDALIVGINTYQYSPLKESPLQAPAKDAEAIAQLLSEYGDFRIRRLPEVIEDQALRVGRKTSVSLTTLEQALAQLFIPPSKQIPDTALFFFSGHGLRKTWGTREGYLAASDTDSRGNWGFPLQSLQRLLRESPIQQIIVWLDCCHSGELLNLAEIDPGSRDNQKSLFLIASSRDFEPSYEEIGGSHSVLTAALLEGLDPRRQPNGEVTSDSLIQVVQQRLAGETQQPLWAHSGQEILIAGTRSQVLIPNLEGTCPYKGLEYFDVTDAVHFHGRSGLTDQLLDQVKIGRGNFLAVLGASGSGKSSVVRAGLIYQLQQGHKLSGSDRWRIQIMVPGEQPLVGLAEVFLDTEATDIDRAEQLQKAEQAIAEGANGLARLIRASQAPRTLLVIDQFEELFTLCHNLAERQQFLDCLLGALKQAGDQFCVVIAMRADFFSQCTEQHYSGLADQIQDHLVTVTPMTAEELKQAICEPARQAGLRVDDNLVTQILSDLSVGATEAVSEPAIITPIWEPGSLPLLEYTLEQLWQFRTLDRLTLDRYVRLGGVREALENQAEKVFEDLNPEEQQAAKRIFLALTQLGEGTEDTRRRVARPDLVNSRQSEELVDRVIRILASKRLIVTSELIAKAPESHRVISVEIAHETLIRHWRRLREWIRGNREAIRIARKIEAIAQDWQNQGEPREIAYLLQGRRLVEAEGFLQDYGDLGLLSNAAQHLIQVSQEERDRLQREEKERQQRELEQQRKATRDARRATIAVATTAVAIVGAIGFGWHNAQELQKNTLDNWSQASLALSPEGLNFLNDAIGQAEQYRKDKNVDKALAYYRRIRATTFASLEKIVTEPETLQTLLNSDRSKLPPALQTFLQAHPDVKTLLDKSQQAEQAIAELIQTDRLQPLVTDLKNETFGEVIRNAKVSDLDARYTEGALRETYRILMQNNGAGADLNNNGILDSQQEADQIPCDVLIAIEQLWQEKGCSWYDQNPYIPFSTDCKGLKGKTLANQIFGIAGRSDYPIAVDRIKECKATLAQRKPINKS